MGSRVTRATVPDRHEIVEDPQRVDQVRLDEHPVAGHTAPEFIAAARGRFWPKAAIIGIRQARQLLGDKLPTVAMEHDGWR